MKIGRSPLLLSGIEVFCKAAELNGFTTAANALGITPAAVSRSVGRLEEQIGVQLFVRTTRQVRLTEAGSEFHAQCCQALALISDAASAVTDQERGARGLVRVSVATTYAYYRLLPALPRFSAAYPKVQVQISISGRDIDFVDGGVDVAIRLGEQRDSSIRSRGLEYAELGVFAHPDYLVRHGTPRVVADLFEHDCICFVMSGTGRAMPWFFLENGVDLEHTPTGSVRIRDDPLAMVHLAAAGGGVCQTFQYIAAEHVAADRLVEVLARSRGRPRQYTLLYAHSPHMPGRVRAFVDFVVDALKGEPLKI